MGVVLVVAVLMNQIAILVALVLGQILNGTGILVTAIGPKSKILHTAIQKTDFIMSVYSLMTQSQDVRLKFVKIL
jgi:hypothetical protein